MAGLDRQKARTWLVAQFGLPDQPDEIGEDELDALAQCVLEDPRIAQIRALCDRAESPIPPVYLTAQVPVPDIRAILDGAS